MGGVLLRGIVAVVRDLRSPWLAARFRVWGGIVGVLLVLLLPWKNAPIGAAVGLAGYFLGWALGGFIDVLRENPKELRPSTWGRLGSAVSVVLGAVGLVAWLIPLVGIPITAAGVLAGCSVRHTSSRGAGLFGWGLSLCCLYMASVNSYLGMLLALLE